MNIYRLINRFAAWGLQVSTSKCELITPRRLVARSSKKVKNPFFLPTAVIPARSRGRLTHPRLASHTSTIVVATASTIVPPLTSNFTRHNYSPRNQDAFPVRLT